MYSCFVFFRDTVVLGHDFLQIIHLKISALLFCSPVGGLSDVVPFQSKEGGRLFGPWTTIQENGSSLLCDVISVFHSPTKQA